MERLRTDTRSGAYGFRIYGVDATASQLVQAPAHWPPIELRVHVTGSVPAEPEPDYVDPNRARLRVRSGGSVVMDRAAGHATFNLAARPTATALVHPHLAAVAAVWSHWYGRDGFHAGAFVAAGGVWGLLGEKGSGKSSTLAGLARLGVPIVCDDVLALERGTAYAGPRALDLRADAARAFGTGEPLGMIGDRERWRVALEPIAPELPFHGWVALRWSDRTAVGPLRGADRLRELLEHRALLIPPASPTTLMDLSSLPFVELSRPRVWGSLDSALGLLLETLGA